MIAVLQRVADASVDVGDKTIARIGHGLLILVCVVDGDTETDVDLLTRKITKLRIFDDEKGVMNLSVADVDGEILAVSQFTLAANVRKGNRPSYIKSAKHDIAIPLYEKFCGDIEDVLGKKTQKGQFGADMKVKLTNDGPVTIIINSDDLK